MEDEWEEEEQLVVTELSGVIDSDMLCKRGGVCKMVAMSSQQPVVQVGRYVFAGEYEDTLGTCVIFEETNETKDGMKCSANPVLKYKCHSQKKLLLQRTFLSERKEGEVSSGGMEVLTLNEGDMCGRANTVCHYSLDTNQHQTLHTTGEDISEESDTEKAGTQQRCEGHDESVTLGQKEEKPID